MPAPPDLRLIGCPPERLTTASEPIDVLSDDTAPAAGESPRTSMRVRRARIWGRPRPHPPARCRRVVCLRPAVRRPCPARRPRRDGRPVRADLETAASRLLDTYGGCRTARRSSTGRTAPWSSPTSRSGGRSPRTSSSPRRWPWVGMATPSTVRSANARTGRSGASRSRPPHDVRCRSAGDSHQSRRRRAGGVGLEASVVVGDDHTYSVIYGRTGRTVDKRGAIAEVTTALSSFDAPAEVDADLVTTTVEPTVSTPTRPRPKRCRPYDGPITVAVATRRSRSRPTKLRPLVTFGLTADGGSINPAFDESGLDPISRRWPRRSTSPRGTPASSSSADTSSPPAPAARAERLTPPA